jgi:hypothetical protein
VRTIIPILILIFITSCKKEERAAAPSVADDAPIQLAASRIDAKAQAQGAPTLAEPSASSTQAPERMIVRTANVRIIVGDTSKTVEAVTKSIEAAGGYVSDSQIWRDGELLRARVTMRVPADKLTQTLAAIRSLAKRVENETISSSEVTAEYVDLESRVRNLEATENELRELLKVVRLNSRKASEVLEVHQQFTAIREQIEQARGRMRYLSQVSAMSSVSVEIIPDAIAQPVVEPGWRPVVIAKDASRALIGVLQTMGTAAIWLIIYLVPIAGILVFVIAIAWKARRRLARA